MPKIKHIQAVIKFPGYSPDVQILVNEDKMFRAILWGDYTIRNLSSDHKLVMLTNDRAEEDHTPFSFMYGRDPVYGAAIFVRVNPETQYIEGLTDYDVDNILKIVFKINRDS